MWREIAVKSAGIDQGQGQGWVGQGRTVSAVRAQGLTTTDATSPLLLTVPHILSAVSTNIRSYKTWCISVEVKDVGSAIFSVFLQLSNTIRQQNKGQRQ